MIEKLTTQNILPELTSRHPRNKWASMVQEPNFRLGVEVPLGATSDAEVFVGAPR